MVYAVPSQAKLPVEVVPAAAMMTEGGIALLTSSPY